MSYDHLYGPRYDLISEFAETLGRERVKRDLNKNIAKY